MNVEDKDKYRLTLDDLKGEIKGHIERGDRVSDWYEILGKIRRLQDKHSPPSLDKSGGKPCQDST